MVHLFYLSISICDSVFHFLLSGGHLGSSFLNGLDVTIILFLFNWLCWLSWLIGKLLLLHLDLLLDGGFTLNEHLLELSGFLLGLSYGLDVVSVSINSWVFKFFLSGKSLFFGSILGSLCSSLRCSHLGPWLILWHELGGGSSDSGGLIDIWGIWDSNFLSNSG